MSASVYIGAEVIRTSLGESAESNFDRILAGHSGIALKKGAGWKASDVYLSEVLCPPLEKYRILLDETLRGLEGRWDTRLLKSSETLVIVSSTKGDLDRDIANPFDEAITRLMATWSLSRRPLVISNACISGVMAINLGARLLKAGLYRNVVVLGCDVISDFVLFGFQALFAVSDEPCRPFDLTRKGVSLGDGAGAIVLSIEKSTFSDIPAIYLGGKDANDANHISGPSRTGEGLFRAVSKAMAEAQVDPQDIGYVNAHGTGTVFNDEMESIAFTRLGLENVPLNSLKGYWGHTLGAAGVIETAACLQALRKGIVPASIGYETPGTSQALRILTENSKLERDIILKTASGFGGGNAALILKML